MNITESQIVTGNTSHTRPENRAFYPALDGLRAIAFLLVFLQHYLQFPYGWAGVDLFFVLSGFLITGILFDTRNDPHRVRNFYVRRTLRIFPLYYGILLAMVLTWPILHWQWTWSWLVWPAYLGNFARFIHPYAQISQLQRLADFQPRGYFHSQSITLFLGHFWSLCVEEQFYLLWPWIVFWIRDRRKLIIWCYVTIVLCFVMRLAGQHFLPTWMLDGEILYRATPFRLDALLLGGLIALLMRSSCADRMLAIARRLTPIILLVVLYLLADFAYSHYTRLSPTYPSWRFTWGLTLIDLLSGLVILIAIQPATLIARALNRRSLRWLGRISYGAYVLHDIPHKFYLELASRLTPSHPLITPALIALPCTFFFAWLSFRFWESPFLNLKERWTIHCHPQTLSAAPVVSE